MENDEYDENCEPSPELLRLIEQEAREIKPHQEEVEMVNLGDEGEEKNVKIGAGLTKDNCFVILHLCFFSWEK